MGWTIDLPTLYEIYPRTSDIAIPAFLLLTLAVVFGNYLTTLSKCLCRWIAYTFFPSILAVPMFNLLTASGTLTRNPDGSISFNKKN